MKILYIIMFPRSLRIIFVQMEKRNSTVHRHQQLKGLKEK
jgi:hypothetical protein